MRTRVAVFLNWCANEGLILASPLAGYRNPRRSRSQIVDRPGRALEDWELPIIWRCFDAASDPIFAAYLLVLLLSGQRRTETALMTWSNVDLGAGMWTIPASVAKSARAHRVPLPSPLQTVLLGVPRLLGSDLVFPGRGGVPMSGFSKRLLPVYAETKRKGLAPWTIHDLRRTLRTGLGALKVLPHVAELVLNHALTGELARIYDRGDYWAERVKAAERWAAHVLELVDDDAARSTL
jgi:integrase